MYTAQDLERAQAQEKKWALYSAALAGVGIVLLVCALVVRVKALAYLGLLLPVMAAYFTFDVFFSPRHKYACFLQDMLNGRSHQAQCVIKEVDPQARHSEDGVQVHDVSVRVQGEEADSLFYWDDQRPLPQAAPEKPVRITAYGRYITNIEQL